MFAEALSYDDVLLVPGYSEVLPRNCDTSTTLCRGVSLKAPIISAAMDTVTEFELAITMALEGGAGVIHRNLNPAEQARQVALVKNYDGRGLTAGAAISPQDFETRLPLLEESGVDFVVMDTAHGDTKNVMDALAAIKKRWKIPVIAGNAVTRGATRRLIDAGADAVKIGLGPGSICTTRIVSGVGVPQLSAVWDCAEEAAGAVPVIADGGIRFSGDLTKAIAAGADAVMIGSLFAGVREAPGREIVVDGRRYKECRGMGSLGALKDGSGDRYQIAKDEEPTAEGVEGRVPYKGELRPFLRQLIAGLRKGMGYTGCATIAELKAYRSFVRITAAGFRESHAHDVHINE